MKALIGKNVLIRTVTTYHVGRLDSVENKFARLAEASWVADTGRFGVALASGKLSEVERFVDDVFVNVGAIVDVTEWAHPLPSTSK